MKVRDRGGKFLSLGKKDGKKRKSALEGSEIGDVAAVRKTKHQLELFMKKLQRDSDKRANGGDSPSSKQSPSSAAEKKYMSKLSAPDQEQVGRLKSLPSWDVDSAVKIINIPDVYVKQDLTAGDNEDAGNATIEAAVGKKWGKKVPSRKTGPGCSPKESPSAATKKKAKKTAGGRSLKASPTYVSTESAPLKATIPHEAAAKLKLEEPARELGMTESLPPLEVASSPLQQFQLDMPPLFSPKSKRASCPSTILQGVGTPTLQDLLELKESLFARDLAKPGILLGQPKTTGELADGELMRPSGAGSMKRSSCPPDFMSPIAPKKRVKLAHQFLTPPPAEEMAPPPAIFRVTSKTVNLSDVVKGLSLEDRLSSLKTPTRGQEGTGQVYPAVAAAPSFYDWWGSADENYTPTQFREKDSCDRVGSMKPAASSGGYVATLDDLKDISCLFGVKSPEQAL
jgi:hypothetical protein